MMTDYDFEGISHKCHILGGCCIFLFFVLGFLSVWLWGIFVQVFKPSAGREYCWVRFSQPVLYIKEERIIAGSGIVEIDQ